MGDKRLADLNVVYYFVFVQMRVTAKEEHHYFKLSFQAPKHLKRYRAVKLSAPKFPFPNNFVKSEGMKNLSCGR